MNEPANFVDGDVNGGCPQNSLNNPPFVPKIEGGYLPSKTLCGDHVHEAGNHYDTHSLYGWFQSEPTLTGTREGTGKRALVLSRSTFLGSGHWVAHWLGDNWSKWDNLHFSIIGMLQFGPFMWDTGLLISPVVLEGALSVEAYFPNARFYNYLNGEEEVTKGHTVTSETPMDAINLHVRGGNVLPTQEPAVNTEISRGNPLGLIVALDEDGKAKGSLFYDDGDSIGTIESGDYYLADFKVSAEGILESTVVRDGYPDMKQKKMDTVRLLGAKGTVARVTVNGQGHSDFEQLGSGEVVIKNLELDPTVAFTISWS